MRSAEQSVAAFNYLTVGEVAAQIHASRRQVLRLIVAGELEAIDISAPPAVRPTYRVSPAAVAAWVKARTRKAA
jgi:excisionase family DNA binding protein